MITLLDYQLIVDIAGEVLKYAVPIGVIFGVCERVGNMFISAVAGEKRVRF